MHGYWHGHYNSYWHHMWDNYPALAAFGVTAWGVNRLAYTFGYWNYYNPYYVAPVTVSPGVVIDYSQPLVVYDNTSTAMASEPLPAVDSGTSSTSSPPPDPKVEAAMDSFDAARAAFGKGEYDEAMTQVNAALAKIPDDATLHEFRALVLFAQGKYDEAAATMYAVLAVGPGWDWTTLSGLYPDIDVYTKQLRALEEYRDSHPDDPAVRFLLAYQYITCGHTEAATKQLQRVLELQPDDRVARDLLEMTAGPDALPQGIVGTRTTPVAPDSAPDIEPSQIVGDWTADGTGDSSYHLKLTEDGNFTWGFTQMGKSQEVSGVYALDKGVLALEPDSGGTMLAELSDVSGTQFHFTMVGGPKNDPGLVFAKGPPAAR
ncbi:tetratricopeptide repeat protein [Maioricimonas sp. JC845]|uniref:tetratricopeptide repeat protein n=1 Tax=Maioricimonas sp. JC845 TaxID=3232138 RepID=UPI00345A67D3